MNLFNFRRKDINKKLLLIAMLQSIACFGAETHTSNPLLSDTKSVLKIGGYTATGTMLGCVGTAGFVASTMAVSDYNRNVSLGAACGLLGLASFWGAKKSYEKAFDVYKNMKTTPGKEVAKYTALINALGLSSAISYKACIVISNYIATECAKRCS